jgi:hypothetical protein
MYNFCARTVKRKKKVAKRIKKKAIVHTTAFHKKIYKLKTDAEF